MSMCPWVPGAAMRRLPSSHGEIQDAAGKRVRLSNGCRAGRLISRSWVNTVTPNAPVGISLIEMCSPLRGGGGEVNLDRNASLFLEYINELSVTGR
jgi:hypothetical protein